MRETVRSLRAYFILSGMGSLFFCIAALRESLSSPTPIALLVELVGMGFSIAFLYIGFSLAPLLKSSAGSMVTFLYASTAWSVLVFTLSLLEGAPSPTILVTLIATLLILRYLLQNVRRLAAESQVAAPAATPSEG